MIAVQISLALIVIQLGIIIVVFNSEVFKSLCSRIRLVFMKVIHSNSYDIRYGQVCRTIRIGEEWPSTNVTKVDDIPFPLVRLRVEKFVERVKPGAPITITACYLEGSRYTVRFKF